MKLRPSTFPEGKILSPANILSVTGFCLVASGIHDGIDTKKGMTKIALGRTCDLADGWLADITGTSSELGGLVDAGLDKLALLAIATASYQKNNLSGEDFAAILAEDSFNAGATMLAKRRNPNAKLNRSWVGGGSMFFKNAGILLNGVGGAIEQHASEKLEVYSAASDAEQLAMVGEIRRDIALADIAHRAGSLALNVGIRPLGIPTSIGYGVRALR